MPDKFTLRYLPAAQDDLLSILDFIAQDSPTRAIKFIDKLDDRIGLLEIYNSVEYCVIRSFKGTDTVC